ncbi:hypothetical protein F4780DRAFT_792282, partial [Xylariomycetidae sp. FL0641]
YGIYKVISVPNEFPSKALLGSCSSVLSTSILYSSSLRRSGSLVYATGMTEHTTTSHDDLETRIPGTWLSTPPNEEMTTGQAIRQEAISSAPQITQDDESQHQKLQHDMEQLRSEEQQCEVSLVNLRERYGRFEGELNQLEAQLNQLKTQLNQLEIPSERERQHFDGHVGGYEGRADERRPLTVEARAKADEQEIPQSQRAQGSCRSGLGHVPHDEDDFRGTAEHIEDVDTHESSGFEQKQDFDDNDVDEYNADDDPGHHDHHDNDNHDQEQATDGPHSHSAGQMRQLETAVVYFVNCGQTRPGDTRVSYAKTQFGSIASLFELNRQQAHPTIRRHLAQRPGQRRPEQRRDLYEAQLRADAGSLGPLAGSAAEASSSVREPETSVVSHYADPQPARPDRRQVTVTVREVGSEDEDGGEDGGAATRTSDASYDWRIPPPTGYGGVTHHRAFGSATAWIPRTASGASGRDQHVPDYHANIAPLRLPSPVLKLFQTPVVTLTPSQDSSASASAPETPVNHAQSRAAAEDEGEETNNAQTNYVIGGMDVAVNDHYDDDDGEEAPQGEGATDAWSTVTCWSQATEPSIVSTPSGEAEDDADDEENPGLTTGGDSEDDDYDELSDFTDRSDFESFEIV